MNCTKQITLTGYRVRYVDLREPKPRKVLESTQVMDREAVDALRLLGMNPADYIEDRFAHGGFHVVSVERMKARRIGILNLSQLWELAAPGAAANSQAIGNLEVQSHV